MVWREYSFVYPRASRRSRHTMQVLERVLASELNSEQIAAVQPSVDAGLAAGPRGSA